MGVRRQPCFQSPGAKELCWPQFMQAASYTRVREARWAQLHWHSGPWILQMLMAPVLPPLQAHQHRQTRILLPSRTLLWDQG